MSRENLSAYQQLDDARTMLLSDRPTGPVDVMLFYNHAYRNYSGLYPLAGELFHAGLVRFVAVTNNDGRRFGGITPGEANPGMNDCIDNLIQQRIPRNCIIHGEEAFHTRQENDAFLELCKELGFVTAVNLGQPQRLVRFMLGMVEVMKQKEYMMRVYNAAPSSTAWYDPVFGSQSMELLAHYRHIQAERERVLTYQETADPTGKLASFGELFAYLAARDSGGLLLGPIGRERFIQ